MITVRHSSSKYIHKETVEGLRNGDGISLERISIAVDSHVEMETDLQYPFYIPVDDSAWVFGLAMQGCISCVTLYANECLPLSLVQLIHSMGPYASDLTIGVACPQNSFDTGHVTLGTLITKGNLAAKCCRSSTVFSINAQSLQRGAHLPQNSPGKLYLEHIEMENCSASVDDEMKVVAFGNCKVTQSLSWIDAWLDAGGCAAGVYLLNLYTNTIKNVYHRVQRIKEQFPDKIQAIKQHEFIISTVFQCISSTLDLLVTLLFVSTELKEQFLQTHSFHVLASFLANLPDSIKKQLITEDFVDKCFSLVSV